LPPEYTYREAAKVDKAVNEYDEQLRFGRNEETGQWVIILVRGEQRIPVLGFNDIPHPDDALKRLYKSDARRRGLEILDEINKGNEAIQAESAKKATEAAEETAEYFEQATRWEGATPHFKSFPLRKRD
jgi:hypothetical protein